MNKQRKTNTKSNARIGALCALVAICVSPLVVAYAQTLADVRALWSNRDALVDVAGNVSYDFLAAWEQALLRSVERNDLTNAQAVAIVRDVERTILGDDATVADSAATSFRQLKQILEEQGRSVAVSRTTGEIVLRISDVIAEENTSELEVEEQP